MTSRTVVLPLAVVLALSAGGAALAAQARADAAQALSVATFGAQPSTSATTSSQSGPLVLSYVDNQDKAARVFFLRSTGSLPLTGQTWTVSITNTAAGTKGEASLLSCSTGYSATGTCSGTETAFLTASETSSTAPVTVTTAFPVAAGGAVSVKFQPNQIRGYNASISTSVSRDQARAATTSSS